MTLHLVIASEFAAERTSCGPNGSSLKRVHEQKPENHFMALIFSFLCPFLLLTFSCFSPTHFPLTLLLLFLLPTSSVLSLFLLPTPSDSSLPFPLPACPYSFSFPSTASSDSSLHFPPTCFLSRLSLFLLPASSVPSLPFLLPALSDPSLPFPPTHFV